MNNTKRKAAGKASLDPLVGRPRSEHSCVCASRCVRVRHEGKPCYAPNCMTGYTRHYQRKMRKANNAVRGAAEPRTLDGLVGSSEVPK